MVFKLLIYQHLHSGSPLQITSGGFQFLLHSPHAQLWDLLLQYLRMAEVCYNCKNYLKLITCINIVGKEDGSCGSSKFSVHVIYHGTWQS